MTRIEEQPDLHATSEADSGNAGFPCSGSFQRPDSLDWQNHDHDVCGNIGKIADLVPEELVEACSTFDGFIPRVSEGRAFELGCDNCRNAITNQKAHDYPAGCSCPFIGENSQVQNDDRYAR